MSGEVSKNLQAAENIRDPNEYIATVKGIVARSLTLLDRTPKIIDTGYFNHSAIPDLVIRWSKGRERLIYLRDSYAAIRANQDAMYLKKQAPVLVAYSHVAEDPQVESSAVTELSKSLEAGTRTLVTEPDAVDRIRGEGGEGQSSPFTALLRGNFLESARGVVDEDTATNLVEVDKPITDEQVAHVFVAEVASRISAARLLVQIASNADADPRLVPPLSKEQAKQLLPWLLTAPEVRRDNRFWRYLGEELDLEFLLKQMRELLKDIELEPLVEANADRLLAVRGYLGVGRIEPDNEYPKWSIKGGRLTRTTERSTMVFATNRHLEGAPDTSSATWPQLVTALRSFRLRSVSLRGLERDVHLDTERSHDLRQDVEQISASLEDRYFVNALTVGFGSIEEELRVHVDLDRRLASAEPGASVEQLMAVLTRIVGYRLPEADKSDIQTESW